LGRSLIRRIWRYAEGGIRHIPNCSPKRPITRRLDLPNIVRPNPHLKGGRFLL
jgi:hypothetical protein